MIWRGQILGYKLLKKRGKVWVGSSKRATFNTPRLGGQQRFLLISPRRDGYVLHLAPELKGDLVLGGTATSVTDVQSSEVDLGRGDRAKLTFADGSDLRVDLSSLQFGEQPAAQVGRLPVRRVELFRHNHLLSLL